MKHTKTTASKIMDSLEEIGIRTKLIGSVESKGISKNDIDLVLLDYPTINNKLVAKIAVNFNIQKYTITDWGGILLKILNYGNIDLFPNSFMRKCYDCNKKCCLTK